MEVSSESIIAGATVVQVIVTIVLVCITNRYARTTKKILDQNQQMRVDAQKPEIALYPAQYRILNNPYERVGLFLENTGAGPAFDVEFTYNPFFKIRGETNDVTLESVHLLRGMDYLPSKQKIIEELCTISDAYFDTLKEKQFAVGVTYKDSLGKGCQKTLPINFNKRLQLKSQI